MRFIPHTDQDIREMLETIGIKNVDQLFSGIPTGLRLGDTPLRLPSALSESEVVAKLRQIQKRNPDPEEVSSFLGAGAYRHYSPALIDSLIQRGEFSTSYTPYQAEVSQGTLQAIFEFQTMITMLTGMDVANASMYDGASALAEAVLMSNRINKQKEYLIASSVHPEYRQTTETYLRGTDLRLINVPYSSDGKTDFEFIRANLNDRVSAVILQSPNFFGIVEEYEQLGRELKEQNTLLIVVVVEPLSLGILKPPGEREADIVVGEAQSFGLPVSYGGPYAGFFATRKKFVRQIPGRLAGETIDRKGRRSFVLTISTREQFIRREKATSNICTNQGLCMLAATIYLAVMGKQGLRELALLNLRKVDYLKNKLSKVKGFSVRFNSDTFNEVVLRCPRPATEIRDALLEYNILVGLPLGDYYHELADSLLICTTELNTVEAIDRLAEKLGTI
ncbi:MAG TPA: aminomethyl-transferring glycine dehydrogenase subunit GcvPA [Nitrospinaceae bacterium]|nr:aminomethyl-transferring glycine dehydrogenase subunit GcvPA [Nitrospinaceae bacterium]